jgi:hypothetical protein
MFDSYVMFASKTQETYTTLSRCYTAYPYTCAMYLIFYISASESKRVQKQLAGAILLAKIAYDIIHLLSNWVV